MSQINTVFKAGYKTLIAYVTVGYPSIEATMKVVPLLAESGCDLVELGIPFSDPLADGVTIQQASYKALQNGMTVKTCLTAAKQLSRQIGIPQVFMTYFNLLLNYGLEKFCYDSLAAGVSGLIIPDLLPDEGIELEACACSQNIDLIYLLAPNSLPARVKLVAERSRGFVYLVSLTGVTGARRDTSDIAAFVGRVRKATGLPLCIGFGVYTPEQAAEFARLADGVIIGSRIIQMMEADPSLKSVGEFIKGVRRSLDGVK